MVHLPTINKNGTINSQKPILFYKTIKCLEIHNVAQDLFTENCTTLLRGIKEERVSGEIRELMGWETRLREAAISPHIDL